MKKFSKQNSIIFLSTLLFITLWIFILYTFNSPIIGGRFVKGLDSDSVLNTSNVFTPLYQVLSIEDEFDIFYTTSQIEVLEFGKENFEISILGYILYEDSTSSHVPLLRMISEDGEYVYVFNSEEYSRLENSEDSYKLDKVLGYLPDLPSEFAVRLIRRSFNNDGKLVNKFFTLKEEDYSQLSTVTKPDEFVDNIYPPDELPQKTSGYDIFIAAGQSNNHNGAGLDSVKDYVGPKIFQYGRGKDNKKIISANEPLDFVGKSIDQDFDKPYNSYVGTFAKYYRDTHILKPYRDILILPAARGGAGFTNRKWNSENVLFKDLVERVNELTALSPTNEIKVLFWQQGETDAESKMSKEKYEKSWLAMINEFDQQVDGFDESTKVLIGQMVPSWIKEVPRRVKIDKAHKNLPNLRRNTYFISALFPFEIGNNDEFELGLENSDVHYSATSQRILGKRYFDVYSGSIFSSSL